MAVDISIVIPCRDHASELEKCLTSIQLQQTTSSFEIIVIDSAFDADVDTVVKNFPGVRLVRSRKPLLAGAARNLGVQNARSDVIGLLDADCIAGPGWVEAALRTISQGAVLGGGAIKDLLQWHWIATSDNRLQYVDFPAGRPAGESSYFPGASLVCLRKALEEVGGFDDTVESGQDVLFTTRVADQWPGRTRFNPKMIVYHAGRTGLADFNSHQWRFGYARARYRIRVTRAMVWLGQHRYLAWLLVLRRLIYLSLRVLQWNIADLPRFVWQMPILLVGLSAWTRGFYQGLHDRRSSRTSGSGSKSDTLPLSKHKI